MRLVFLGSSAHGGRAVVRDAGPAGAAAGEPPVLHAPTRPWGCWRARGQAPTRQSNGPVAAARGHLRLQLCRSARTSPHHLPRPRPTRGCSSGHGPPPRTPRQAPPRHDEPALKPGKQPPPRLSPRSCRQLFSCGQPLRRVTCRRPCLAGLGVSAGGRGGGGPQRAFPPAGEGTRDCDRRRCARGPAAGGGWGGFRGSPAHPTLIGWFGLPPAS